ncbi:hypothetical protein J1N35_034834 [Gossypium stocksii]|uniref:Uncharacterized protein n=1 Tax=Gossypium stocksii TaxID=47602 RepID=A0A9D3ZQD5_9ROSI|nr:hypothetical protein J1N35_034834 [Gossypium stocksii]
MAPSLSTLMVVLVAVCALMGSAIAADAPAPSPTSGTGSISPSFVSVSPNNRCRIFPIVNIILDVSGSTVWS